MERLKPVFDKEAEEERELLKSRIRSIFGENFLQQQKIEEIQQEHHFVTSETPPSMSLREVLSYWNHVNGAIESFIDELKIDLIEENEISIEDGIISFLENHLINNIYDFVLKNPTFFPSKSSSITEARKQKVREQSGNICQLCQLEFSSDQLEVDHIFPYGLGGSNQDCNLMSLCQECNADKEKRLDYYQGNEGRHKLKSNIQIFIRQLPIIQDFGQLLKNIGDKHSRD